MDADLEINYLENSISTSVKGNDGSIWEMIDRESFEDYLATLFVSKSY
jgi:hypothetical protein